MVIAKHKHFDDERESGLIRAASVRGNDEAASGRCLRLLAVEDNPADASLITERWAVVPGYSFQVTVRGTLEAAMDALSSARFDAVVVDSNLPDAQGAESVQAVASMHPELPIIVVSGNDTPNARRAALRAGANAFIGKGETGTELLGCYVVNTVERCHSRTKQWEQLVAAGPDATIVTGFDGVVRFVNQSTLELFGKPRSEFIGRTLDFPITPGETREIEILRAGDRRFVELRVATVEWQGELAYLASIRDNTERRRAEAALAAADRMVTLGTLSASMAHDVNSPLSAVLGNLELALSSVAAGGDPAEVVATLQDACEATGRVRDIVRDFRIFARGQSDMLSPIDVHAVIASTLRIARNEIRHHAELVCELEPVAYVLASESRLGQVLLNLVVNAAQAIPEGHARDNRITVSARQLNAETVEIAISDTGVGMSKETQARLFTPFFTTKAADQGSGLGLSICDRIVRSFSGSIGVESTPGEGTTFRVRLRASESGKRASIRPAHGPRVAYRARIFVIDDERKFAAILERALSGAHEVRAFESAAQALKRLRRGEPCDAIFCDLMMPEMMGIDFLAAVEELRPELASKIVFTTGGAFTARARDFLAKNHNLLLEKPFSFEVLRSTLDSLLQ